ncbi:MAG: hypothetical protein ACI4ES_05450 [Roseburia sp.]
MDFEFHTYSDFLREYEKYPLDKCSKCKGVREIRDDDVTIIIEDRTLHFPQLLVLCCINCGEKCLPEYSKGIIDGAYKAMIEHGQFVGEFVPKNFRKRFDYCQEQDFVYDHKDYYNIPGLCYDEEHSKEGFLTPVYFDRKALIYFISVPDYEVDIFSESYGHICKKDSEGIYVYDWNVPFGFNSNGKLVFWLGDLSSMDAQSQAILKGFNIDSDHLLIESEFYQAQMNCVCSEPIKEKQILINKENFITNIKKKYNIDLTHLSEECSAHARNIQRPLVFTEQSVSGVINAFDKVLVEGFNATQLRALYETVYSECQRDGEYKKWQSIRLIKEILVKFCEGIKGTIDVDALISPLYILHDYRIYLDHLLSVEKQESTKEHIVSTLGVQSFSEQETIYFEEIERLNKLFQYLVLLSL